MVNLYCEAVTWVGQEIDKDWRQSDSVNLNWIFWWLNGQGAGDLIRLEDVYSCGARNFHLEWSADGKHYFWRFSTDPALPGTWLLIINLLEWQYQPREWGIIRETRKQAGCVFTCSAATRSLCLLLLYHWFWFSVTRSVIYRGFFHFSSSALSRGHSRPLFRCLLTESQTHQQQQQQQQFPSSGRM